MQPWSHDYQGRLEERVLESDLLKGNPLGDPHVRPIWVYTPPGYDEGETRYPTVYLLLGWTGQVDMWRNRMAFRKSFPELADDFFASQQGRPAILVYVDCWTSLGGSQYLDSPGTGRYHSYLCNEIVPWVDANYRTLPHRDYRAIQGKSSGGYGALVTPMLRPDVFGGLGSHAGDSLFEYCYLPAFPRSLRSLRDDYGGSVTRFLEDLKSRPTFSRPTDGPILSDYSMSSCYSANPDGSIELPYDPLSGEMRPEIWQRWLAWDPVRMIAGHAEALRSMRGIYIDCGRSDEYWLDLGATALARGMRAAGCSEVFFELFEATHAAIEYRYPLSLKYLLERMPT